MDEPEQSPDEEAVEAARDELALSEGVGGVRGIDDDDRATVSDVDGDNVDPDDERNPQV